MILIIYFMLIEIRLLLKLKWNYFLEFWSWIELGIIIRSWSGVGIYILGCREFERIRNLFKETNGYVYINLQFSSYLNNILTFLFSFSSFFGTIKFVRLCRFNSRLLLFIQTLQYVGKELLSFSMMFSILFFSFICLFYLLFISTISSCSTLLSTAQMLFEMTLLKFNATELTSAAAFLGPFCFSLFIFLIVFICMSMFIAIINDSFRRARNDLQDDQQIFSFMFNKFQRWTGMINHLLIKKFIRILGWKKASEEEIHEEYDALMRSEYFDPIECFSHRIDQLLDGLNRVKLTFISIF